MRYIVKELEIDPKQDRFLIEVPYRFVARLLRDRYKTEKNIVGIFDTKTQRWIL